MYPLYEMQLFIRGNWERLSRVSNPEGFRRMGDHFTAMAEAYPQNHYRIVTPSHLADGPPTVVRTSS